MIGCSIPRRISLRGLGGSKSRSHILGARTVAVALIVRLGMWQLGWGEYDTLGGIWAGAK